MDHDPELTQALRRGTWFASPTAGGAGGPHTALASGGRRLLARTIALVSFVVPLAAGGWLAWHGQRMVAAIGVGLAVALPFVWHYVALTPAGVLAAPAVNRGPDAHPLTVTICGFLAGCWQYACLAAWTWWVFRTLGMRGDASWTMLAWMAGVVLAPMAYMSSNDLDIDGGPGVSTVYALLACVAMGACRRFGLPMTTALSALGAVAVLIAGFNALRAGRLAVRQRRVARGRAGESGLGRALHAAMHTRGE